MQTVFKILRRESAEAVPRWQEISFETEDESATVASALRMINESGDYVDAEGSRVKKIIWECSCLQKKCGACAMVINGRPGLACDSFLRDFRKKRGGITLEPLRKFPVIADLMVDRSILFENLKQMELWAKETVHLPEKQRETAYDASRCLQCGCCLEICPNFLPGESFFGAAGFVPAARLIASLALPTTASQLVSTIYNTADTYFVAQIGTSAAAAVGVVFSLMSIIQAMGFGLGMGSNSLISRRLGARKNEEANRYGSSAFAAALLAGCILMVVGLLFLHPLMKLLGSTDTMLPY